MPLGSLVAGLLQSEHIDLVILDIGLPDISKKLDCPRNGSRRIHDYGNFPHRSFRWGP